MRRSYRKSFRHVSLRKAWTTLTLNGFVHSRTGNRLRVIAITTHCDEDLARLARAAEWRMCEFNAKHLANAAWSFATAGQLDASL